MVDIPDLFASDVPDREWVLGQSIPFNPERRRAQVPDPRMWPAELDDCPGTDTRRIVDRRTVFRVADRAVDSADDHWPVLQLQVAVAVWGTGMSAQSSYRAFKPLHQPSVGANLSRALKMVRQEGAVSAYGALRTGKTLKIRGLDASFFTKFLYFGGFGAKRYLAQPLILDDRVARALSRLTGEEWRASTTPTRYAEYLDLAADWAGELGTTEDVIERRLFEIGRVT